ncbi:MAG: hypothetical protein GY804_10635 [Alphaproteobacteria bacterium]|nr:hypothetical protein [Alphaproteobacteria bacterium]
MQIEENIFDIKGASQNTDVSKFMFDLSFDDEINGLGDDAVLDDAANESGVNAEQDDLLHDGTSLPSGVEATNPNDLDLIVADCALGQEIPVVPERMFTQEDLDEASKTAHAIGHAAGNEKAMASIENKLSSSLDIIIPQLAGMLEIHEKQYRNMLKEAVRISLAAAKKAVPAITKKHGIVEVEAVVNECMSFLSTEPKVVIKTANDSVDILKEQIEKIVEINAFEGKLVVVGDDDMQSGDCAIEWQNGGLEKNFEKIWENMDDIVAKNIAL